MGQTLPEHPLKVSFSWHNNKMVSHVDSRIEESNVNLVISVMGSTQSQQTIRIEAWRFHDVFGAP